MFTNLTQGKTAAIVFDHIKLNKEDLDALFTVFDEIDTDGSGVLKMDEFFSYFRLEMTEFNVELFRIFDTDGNGELSFLEFICVVSIPATCSTRSAICHKSYQC